MSLELVEIAGENVILDNETTLKKQSWWSKYRPRTCWGYWWMSKRIPITKWILEYKRKDIINDLIAGLTVAAMAIPQSLAHATVAGMSANRGLHTELFPGFMYLFFGSTKYTIICKGECPGRFPAISISNYLIISASTSITAMIFGPIAKMGAGLDVLLTFLTGILVFFMGILQLGEMRNKSIQRKVLGLL